MSGEAWGIIGYVVGALAIVIIAKVLLDLVNKVVATSKQVREMHEKLNRIEARLPKDKKGTK